MVEIIAPTTTNVSTSAGGQKKITLQSVSAAGTGMPKGWKTAYWGLGLVALGLLAQALVGAAMIVAGAASITALTPLVPYAVVGVVGLTAVGMLQAMAVPAGRDLRWEAFLGFLFLGGASALGVLSALAGEPQYYELMVFLAIVGYGIWTLYLRALSSRFDAGSLSRDALFYWIAVFFGGIYLMLLASPESRISLVENGVLLLGLAIWHMMLIRQGRQAINGGD